MAEYNIYHGCGGYEYDFTDEFSSKEEAMHSAYEYALEDYDSVAGSHGYPSITDIAEDYCELNNISCLDDLKHEDWVRIEDEYAEVVNDTIEYDAILTSEDTLVEWELSRI